ncbi:MAG TPA: thiamine phosphate synthase [Vicinamibacterales bacterium]|nr:thiamine phosphate synthase [Vicinamibacterales bacterium]
MILCLVTDRRRLGKALGATEGDWIDLLRQQVAAAARAGVDFIQVREPDLEAGELTDLVRSLVQLAASTPSRILVNDRIDVALAAKASGVHLKEQSILPADVRRIAPPGFVIGCSVHGIDGLDARKSADFLIAGTVMPTASKPSVDYLDKDGLSKVVKAAAGQPVLGIGGLDLPSIPLLASAAAAGLAAIGAFIPAAGEDVNENVQKRVGAMRFAFDSARRAT